jgi:hypothetical protein
MTCTSSASGNMTPVTARRCLRLSFGSPGLKSVYTIGLGRLSRSVVRDDVKHSMSPEQPCPVRPKLADLLDGFGRAIDDMGSPIFLGLRD